MKKLADILADPPKKTRKQFADVPCKYGAPMGRAAYGNMADVGAKSIELFRIRMVSGDYDDGGAYWGGGRGTLPLYCARNVTGESCYRQFVRATSRKQAAALLGLTAAYLRKAAP